MDTNKLPAIVMIGKTGINLFRIFSLIILFVVLVVNNSLFGKSTLGNYLSGEQKFKIGYGFVSA